MDLKKINIDGKFYNVISKDTYKNNKEFYNNNMNAVEINEQGKEYILPIRSATDTRPGFIDQGSISLCNIPESEEDMIKYSKQNKKFTDFSKCTTMAETIQKQEMTRDIEREILTNPDNITVPNISSLDTPLMKGLKQAIISKKIDIDKYQDRFGANFPNEKRLLKGHSITNPKFELYMNNLDLKATIIIEDANSKVPNPMNEKIVIDLNNSDDIEEGDN